MSTLTIRLPSDQHERLKALAASRGTSINKLFEEFSARALAEFDLETRFRMRAAKGDKQKGLDILDRLDRTYSQSNQ